LRQLPTIVRSANATLDAILWVFSSFWPVWNKVDSMKNAHKYVKAWDRTRTPNVHQSTLLRVVKTSALSPFLQDKLNLRSPLDSVIGALRQSAAS
jgi:hypothetical protein